MFEQIFNSTPGAPALSVDSAIITGATAFLLGVLVSVIYMLTGRKQGHYQNFILTLTMLSPTIAIVVMLIGSNVAQAFSMAGALSLIRFRSSFADPKDIAYIFFALAVGLACGVGLVLYAIIFAALLGFCMIMLHLTHFGKQKNPKKLLKMIVPEDLDYLGAFDDIFEQYAVSYHLDKVRTTDLGSLYELTYSVKLKDDLLSKEFIDKLRCRNGNLNITLILDQIFDYAR